MGGTPGKRNFNYNELMGSFIPVDTPDCLDLVSDKPIAKFVLCLLIIYIDEDKISYKILSNIHSIFDIMRFDSINFYAYNWT